MSDSKELVSTSNENQVVTYNNFEEVKKAVASKYVTFMQNVLKHIRAAGVDQEKHLRNYEKNMNKSLV